MTTPLTGFQIVVVLHKLIPVSFTHIEPILKLRKMNPISSAEVSKSLA